MPRSVRHIKQNIPFPAGTTEYYYAYWLQNRERINIRKRTAYNPSKRKEQIEKWATQNPDKIAQYHKKQRLLYDPQKKHLYYEAHKEQIKARVTAWQVRNPDKHHEYCKHWAQNHPTIAKAGERRRQVNRGTRLAAVYREHINAPAIYKRDKGKCGICHKSVPEATFTIDHILPIFWGGPHVEWNVQIAHKKCNSGKRAGRLPSQLRLPISCQEV